MEKVTPYLELMRLTNPVGSMMVYFPHLSGTLFALAVNGSNEASISTEVFRNSGIFLLISIVLHGAGCSWNDIIDADLDRQVKRTKRRPIPRGAISIHSAYFFTLAETTVWLALLRSISWETVKWSLPLIPATIAYPFSKRYTNYPSVVLGPIICWGVFVGSASAGIDPLDPAFLASTFSLFAAESACIVLHDMVYSHQDLQDDLKVGILSMAVRFRDHPKKIMSVLALTQLVLRLYSGHLMGFGTAYSMSCIGAVSLNVWMIVDVDLGKTDQCWWWFQTGGMLMGTIVTSGLLMQIVL